MTLDNAQLKNFGGMSAIRATNPNARVNMANGSVVTIDAPCTSKSGRKAGVWFQGGSVTFEMQNGTKITNLYNYGLFPEDSTVIVQGELSGNRATAIASNRGNVTIEADGLVANNSGSTIGAACTPTWVPR